MKESINKVPKSAMALYIKLYREKLGKTKSTKFSMTEAAKSWVSMSKADKEYFLGVYNQYKINMKEYIASNLQNAQLYMKKKHSHSKSLLQDHVPFEVEIKRIAFKEEKYVYSLDSLTQQLKPKRLLSNKKRKNKTSTKLQKIKTTDCNEQSYEVIGIPEENSYSIDNQKGNDNEIEFQHESEQVPNTTPLESVVCANTEPDVAQLIPEPTPPIRSSMELFEIIKHHEESTRNLNWVDLTKLQKQRYHRAVVSIKKDYIKQYTAYLEQLSAEQLFHYYKTILSKTESGN